MSGILFEERYEISNIRCRDKRSERTVVRAIRNGDQLLVLFLEREPRFQVVLLGRCIVERARDDADDLIRQLKGLVEAF